MKKINIITGHYGAGKTNVSVNLALSLASQNKKVTVVDLDIVNPYFRTSDFKELFSKHNIELISPLYANSNIEIPAINFDLEQIADGDGYLIVDVGGDDVGATTLGRYYDFFSSIASSESAFDMYYVINAYRLMTNSSGDAVQLMREIEQTSRIKHTALINNSHLGYMTTKETVLDSLNFAKQVSDKTGLPILYNTVDSSLYDESFSDNDFVKIEIYVKPIWDK